MSVEFCNANYLSGYQMSRSMLDREAVPLPSLEVVTEQRSNERLEK